MEIRQYFLTNNDCYRFGRPLIPKGVIVHTTGAVNPFLSRYIGPDDGILGDNPLRNDWNHPNVLKCVHAMIGKDKFGKVRIYQTLPWDMRGWHAGHKIGNDTLIGFEILEDTGDPEYFQTVWDYAIDLCVFLAKTYKFPVGEIMGHYEAFGRGIASNHADPAPYFWKHKRTMDIFRSEVQKRLGEEEVDQTPVYLNGLKYDAHIYGGKTFVELRKFAADLGCEVKYQGSAEKGTVIIRPPEKVCVCDQAELDEVKRALNVLLKIAEV